MADTYSYFVAAYIVAGVVYGAYLASLWWRAKRD